MPLSWVAREGQRNGMQASIDRYFTNLSFSTENVSVGSGISDPLTNILCECLKPCTYNRIKKKIIHEMVSVRL